MGWLFGNKKKVPRVPFPEGLPIEEGNSFKKFNPGSLNLSDKVPKKRIIEPEKIKSAVGIDKGFNFSEDMENMPSMEEESKELPKPTLFPKFSNEKPLFMTKGEPLFIKVDVYQRLLGELDNIKVNVSDLYEANRKLASSEYNEENHFVKLKQTVKQVHDRLLQIDKTLFKS